jgi:hypothetical protein
MVSCKHFVHPIPVSDLDKMKTTFAIDIGQASHPFSQSLEAQGAGTTAKEFITHFYRLPGDYTETGGAPINDSSAWCRWPGGRATLTGFTFQEVDCFGDGTKYAREQARRGEL